MKKTVKYMMLVGGLLAGSIGVKAHNIMEGTSTNRTTNLTNEAAKKGKAMEGASTNRTTLQSGEVESLSSNEGKAESDTLRITDIDEVVVVSTPKENTRLRQQAMSSTSLASSQLHQLGVQSVKDLSGRVPGLFMPSYGSRLTTSIYMRGVGSRINTPAVGLYVDGFTWVDKSGYDFNLMDVERIDVLRGPQSTLYGRNAMGGLLRVFTKDPTKYQGTDLYLGAASYNTYNIQATHYHKVSDKFAFSGGVGYKHQGGFFKNTTLGNSRVDKDDDMTARWRGIWQYDPNTRIDLQANYEYSTQGAYPYYYKGVVSGAETNNSWLGMIVNNRKGSYKRHLLNLGVRPERKWQHAITGGAFCFQFLKDDMLMDQDYTPLDLYTLNQRQNSKIISQDFTIKSLPEKQWQWVFGTSGHYQFQVTHAPVTFYQDGIDWLNGLINTNANAHMPSVTMGNPSVPASVSTMKFNFSDQVQGTELAFPGRYRTNSMSRCVYHQSSIRNLFGVKGFTATVGLNLMYEQMWLLYDASYQFDHLYSLGGQLSSATATRNMTLIPETNFSVNTTLHDYLKHHNWILLPKFALQYEGEDWGNVYATIARGYRSGGYNIQMFSELMRSQMQADMMQNVSDVTLPVMAQYVKDESTRQTIANALHSEGAGDVASAVWYDPEFAWNYEVGTHLNLWGQRLQLDMSAYLTRTTNQQLSQMSENGLGRINVNAGKSQSVGCEVGAKALLTTNLTVRLNYGYTHATFKDYQTLNSQKQTVDYAGNYIPFVPRHTLDVGGQYVWNIKGGWLHHLMLDLDCNAVGPIYWTEQNTARQNFYATLNGRITLTHDKLEFGLWGRNLTQTKADAFYFETNTTNNRAFGQRINPLQFGVDVRLRFGK